MHIDIDIFRIISNLIEEHGVTGFCIVLLAWFLFVFQKKLDKLADLTSQMFGAIMTLANGKKRGSDNDKSNYYDPEE